MKEMIILRDTEYLFMRLAGTANIQSSEKPTMSLPGIFPREMKAYVLRKPVCEGFWQPHS